MSNKSQVLDTLHGLPLPECLKARMVNRTAIIMRSSKSYSDAEKLLEKYLTGVSLTPNTQTHTPDSLCRRNRAEHRWCLLLYADGHVTELRLNEAANALDHWGKADRDSVLGCSLERRRMIVYGKLLRLKGDFSGAVESLSSCLDVRVPGIVDGDANMPKMKAHHAELCCELGHEQAAAVLQDMLKALEYWAKRAPQSKGYRRLLLAVADVCLRTKQYKKAHDCVEEVVGHYETTRAEDALDSIDEVLHVRAVFSQALLEHLKTADLHEGQHAQWVVCGQRWQRVSDAIRAASSFKCPGYLDQFVQYWLAHAASSGQRYRALEIVAGIDQAQLESPQHHFTGCGTYWREYILQKLQSQNLL